MLARLGPKISGRPHCLTGIEADKHPSASFSQEPPQRCADNPFLSPPREYVLWPDIAVAEEEE